jgi:hypothetical protein
MKRRRYTHDPAPIDVQSTANEQPIGGAMDRPLTPRPREQKLLDILVDGDPRSITDAMLKAGINPSATSIRRRLEEGGDLREQYAERLKKKGLTVDKVLRKTVALMDAKKPVMHDGKVALMTEDNEAQLRATEQGIKLLDRGGLIPAKQDKAAGSTSISVNILVMS